MNFEARSSSQGSRGTAKYTQAVSYNAVQSMSKTMLNQIKQDTEILLQAPEKCEQIWQEIRKIQYYSGTSTINYKTMSEIFEKFRDTFVDTLKILSNEDLFETFDNDNDTILNEDEIILIFSTIKEKMQIVANELLKIQDYAQFKALMIEVRKLEKRVCEYQDQLRQHIYKKELNLYHNIGQDKLDDFYDKYDDAFKELEQYKSDRRNQLLFQHQSEFDKLDEKQSKLVELVKIKPKKKLKEYQTQEKLVSLDERVEEALNFRKELKHLEISEQQRVEKLQFDKIEKQKADLQRKHESEMRQLNAKLENEEHKLIIKMKKEYDVLQKKIHLHEHEIKRIQGASTKLAIKRGKYEGDLKRRKECFKKQNEIISQSKQIISYKNKFQNDPGQTQFGQTLKSNRSLEKSESQQDLLRSSTQMPMPDFAKNQGQTKKTTFLQTRNTMMQVQQKSNNVRQLKQLMKSGTMIKFYITQKFGADRPVNQNVELYAQEGGDQHFKIEKYLKNQKKSKYEILPSLSELYDHNLDLKIYIDDKKELSEVEKNRKKKAIEQLIIGTDKKLQ